MREGATQPVRLIVRRARQGRLGALLRLPGAVVALALALGWWVAAVAVALVAWPVRVAGRPYPPPLRRFAAAWLRFAARASCYAFLASSAFPRGGDGRPVDVELPEPRGRPWLRLPAVVTAVPLAILELLVAILCALVAWFAVMVTGRVPDGLADVIEQAQRYQVRFAAYSLLLSDAYPWFEEEVAAVRTPG